MAGEDVETGYQFRVLTASGEERWVIINSSALDWDGKPSTLNFLTDISEQKLAEKEVIAAKERAEEAQRASEAANRAKSAFLANMSHELRTPLNAVLGYAQILSHSQALSPEDRTHLNTITRSGEHLLALINDVLELSKIDADRVELQPVNFDLHQMLADLDAMFCLRAERKGLALRVEYAPDVPSSIRADQGKLRQILINLLGNAVKYTEEGRVKLEVTKVTTVEKDDPQSQISNLKFTIQDTGIGIAPTDCESVFDAFTQVDERQYNKGTGLGLAISRNYVRMMGGDIQVESEPGHGSSFFFELQVERVDRSTLDARHSALQKRAVGVEPGQRADDGRPYHLLIVEDEEANRNLMMSLLQALGFHARAAHNGEEAIACWASWHPHLIWMDMRMPVMDGYAAARKIRELEARHSKADVKRAPSHISNQQAKIPIVALTASAFEEDRAKVLEAGCDDFVRKPFREAEIFEILHKHLGLRLVYEESSPSPLLSPFPEQASIHQTSIEKALTPQALAVLPAECLTSLEHGARGTNTVLLLKAIEQVRAQNAELAEALTRLTDDFEYEKILAFIQQTKS